MLSSVPPALGLCQCLLFSAILGLSTPALRSSPLHPPLSLFSLLPYLPICLFFSLWSPSWLYSQESIHGGPSLTRVPLQHVSPGGVFCEVSSLQETSILPCHTTAASLGKGVHMFARM